MAAPPKPQSQFEWTTNEKGMTRPILPSDARGLAEQWEKPGGSHISKHGVPLEYFEYLWEHKFRGMSAEETQQLLSLKDYDYSKHGRDSPMMADVEEFADWLESRGKMEKARFFRRLRLGWIEFYKK